MASGLKIPAKWPVYGLLIIFSLVALFPFVWVILNSLKTDMEIFTGVFWPRKWLWNNYPAAWKKANMGRFFINSIWVTGLTVVIGLMVDILAGYSFGKMALSRHKWLFYLFLLGIAIPLEANVFSIYLQIRRIGLTNNIWGIVIAMVGTGTAFGSFLMRNFFRDLPAFVGESAKIDGANDLQIFSRIYLPLAGPPVGALAVFKLMSAWNEFNLSLFILTKQNSYTIPLAVTIFQANEFTNYGLVFSSTVMGFIPMVVLTIFFNRSFINGIAAGSVKG